MMLPMKVCIVSDSHDRSDPLAEAVRAAAAEGAEAAARELRAQLDGLDILAGEGGDPRVVQGQVRQRPDPEGTILAAPGRVEGGP